MCQWDPPAFISQKYFSKMSSERDDHFIKCQLIKWLKPIISKRSRLILQAHTMKPTLANQSWLVLRVCAHKVAVIQNFQSQPKELLFSHNNFRKSSHTVRFIQTGFSTNENRPKNTTQAVFIKSSFHAEIVSMIDIRGKRQVAAPKHSNHYWRHKLWTGNISFPTCQVGSAG